MNEEQTNVASLFKEEDLRKWLIAKAALYNIPTLLLKMDSDDKYPCAAYASGAVGIGETFDDAVADVRKKLPTPDKLRDQVAVLLKQADALSRQAEEMQGQANHIDELRTEAKRNSDRPNIHA
jgi:hypothetical protein